LNLSPSRQHSNIKTKLPRFLDDIIHMLEVGLVRLTGIVVDQRRLPVSVGNREAIEFRENNRLDHGKSLRGAPLQIEFRFLPIEPVKEFPRGVPQPEKGATVFPQQITAVVADGQRLRYQPSARSALGIAERERPKRLSVFSGLTIGTLHHSDGAS
jgi:hypothetical protein